MEYFKTTHYTGLLNPLHTLAAHELAQMEYLAKYHTEELQAERFGEIKLDWARMLNASLQGYLDSFLLYHDVDGIVGYLLLQYSKDYQRNQINAHNGGVFLHPEHRKGLLAKKWFESIFKYIKKNKPFVNGFIEMDTFPQRDFGSLLEYMGFKFHSYHYMLMIEDIELE